jgi:hypothetical protein
VTDGEQAVSVQPLPARLPRTQRHHGAVIVEKGAGGPICFGNTVHLRGRGGRYIDVEGSAVAARWTSPGEWQARRSPRASQHPRVTALRSRFDLAPISHGLPVQALCFELHGSEAAHGRSSPPIDAKRVVCHGDIVCVRAHTGRLLRLATPAKEGEREGELPELRATADCHDDAQRWEVLLA